MFILGLSFGYHDAAAALLFDGQLVAAAQEERFSRIKHDAAYPEKAVQFCCESAQINAKDVDVVVYYENPLTKFDRVLAASFGDEEPHVGYLDAVIASWREESKFDPAGLIASKMGIPASRIVILDHHQSHAAAAFFTSGFDVATVVSLDGVGEYETLSVSRGRGCCLDKLYSQQLPHSLGLFYSAMTAFLGFEVNEGEYKVMGMSGFGEPVHAETLRSFVRLKDDGTFEVDQKCFEFMAPGELPFNKHLTALFGPARVPDSYFDFASCQGPFAGPAQPGTSRHYANIAASVQLVTEEVVAHVVRSAVAATGALDVCLAGGVALNSVANGKLARSMAGRLYVQPAAGDSGSALGAALYLHHCQLGLPRVKPLTQPNLGKAYGEQDIKDALRRSGMKVVHICTSETETVERTAQLLADGLVVGWAQGRFEWGPRSLGFRSILADPTIPGMQGKVNAKIKFREAFRPFAPAVPVERAEEFFHVQPNQPPWSPDYFMLSVAKVREEVRESLPAITHVDGTARVQLVHPESNPLFHALITRFGEIGGTPVLLNTSFNLRGEPIVSSPDDAMSTFSWSNIDILVFNNYIISREIAL